MNVLEMYVTYVIEPIEKNIQELQVCYYSKNIFKYPYKWIYKKYINQYSQLLHEKLKYLERLMEEEHQFNEKIKK